MRARIQKISRHAPSIFQGRLTFDVRRGISLAVEHPAERYIFRMLAGSLAILAIAYIYLVGTSIVNVIGRKDTLTEVSTLASKVSALEREYFAASQGIGPEDGARLGLSPVANTLYVRRPGNAVAGTLESNEI